MPRTILALALVAGCGATIADAPADDTGADEGLASQQPILRMITGDATAIQPDWTATEAGHHFDLVTDGTPSKPWISSAHAFGTSSLAFAVPTDTSGHKQRIEYKIARASDGDGLHFDNARYSGFAFKLGADPAPFTGTAIIWQAWQGFPWGPPASLKLTTDSAPPYRLKLAIRNASTGPDSTVPDIELWSNAMIEPNTWYTVVLYVKPRYQTSGNIKLWIDGTKEIDWTGEIGYDPASVKGAYAGLDVKNGIYQPSANNGHTIYFDQIIFATSYAATAAALGW